MVAVGLMFGNSAFTKILIQLNYKPNMETSDAYGFSMRTCKFYSTLTTLFLLSTIAHAEIVEINCGVSKQVSSDGKIYEGNIGLYIRFDLDKKLVGPPDNRKIDLINDFFITWSNSYIYETSGTFKYVNNVFNRRTKNLTITNIVMNQDYSDTRSFITTSDCN